MTRTCDVAVVGGGIVGLSHAWAAARRGLRVRLFERDELARGGSVRNFGMIWPVGQPAGPLRTRALRSRELWLEAAQQAGIRAEQCGSLHLAREMDELAILEEFANSERGGNLGVELITPEETVRKSSVVRQDGLLAALWSTAELCVDPREAIARLPKWLAERYDVALHYGTTVVEASPGRVRTADGKTWEAGQVLVCSGVDFSTLFPDLFARSGVRKCKLHMMRTVPQPSGHRVGPHLAGGLTLTHYSSFAGCPSLGRLKQRVSDTMPEYARYGVHVMCSQTAAGEVTIGDSHEYDADITPFDKLAIDRLILDYFAGFCTLPDPTIAERWAGYYAKHPTLPLYETEPLPGVYVLVAPGGAGMTMSFGQADEWWADR